MIGTSDQDASVRAEIYRQFAERPAVPGIADIASALGLTFESTRASLRRLADAKALALRPDGELLMAHPFSAVPTRYRVEGSGRSWWANCAWDALGFAPMLGIDIRVESTCPDCDASIEVEVRDGALVDRDLRMHFALPPRQWWADIVFT